MGSERRQNERTRRESLRRTFNVHERSSSNALNRATAVQRIRSTTHDTLLMFRTCSRWLAAPVGDARRPHCANNGANIVGIMNDNVNTYHIVRSPIARGVWSSFASRTRSSSRCRPAAPARARQSQTTRRQHRARIDVTQAKWKPNRCRCCYVEKLRQRVEREHGEHTARLIDDTQNVIKITTAGCSFASFASH